MRESRRHLSSTSVTLVSKTCFRKRASRSFPARFGLRSVHTYSRVSRGFPEHAPSCSPDTVSTILQNQRNFRRSLESKTFCFRKRGSRSFQVADSDSGEFQRTRGVPWLSRTESIVTRPDTSLNHSQNSTERSTRRRRTKTYHLTALATALSPRVASSRALPQRDAGRSMTESQASTQRSPNGP